MPTSVPAQLSESEVIAIARRVLRGGHWAYDESQSLRARWHGIETDVPGREGWAFRLWGVRFTTPAEPFDRFLAIDDEMGEPVYILLGPGHYSF